MTYKVILPQDISEAGKRYLHEHGCETKLLEDSSLGTICREVREADGILARGAAFPAAVFEAGTRLKVISRNGVGYNNVDVEAATRHGVRVCFAPLSNMDSVAEHAMTLLLACAKNLLIQDAAVRAGDYDSRNRRLSTEVAGKTLGIIGCGHVGQALAKRAALGLDMQVIGWNRTPREDLPDYLEMVPSVEDVCRRADYISLHIPLTPETRNMIDERMLSIMKPTAVLINTARGCIVDEAALARAIREKRLAGAGVDVFASEIERGLSLDPDNPLFGLKNVVLSPHNAALSREAMDRMDVHAAQGIIDVLNGREPAWPVN